MDVKRTIFIALLGLFFVLQFADETYASGKRNNRINSRGGNTRTSVKKIIEPETEEEEDIQVAAGSGKDTEDEDRTVGNDDDEDEEDDDDDDGEVDVEDEIESPAKLGGENIPDEIHGLIELISTKIIEFTNKNTKAKKTVEYLWQKVENIATNEHGSELVIKISGLIKTTLKNQNGQEAISHVARMLTKACTQQGGIDFVFQSVFSIVQILVSEETIPALETFNNSFAGIFKNKKRRTVMTTMLENLFKTLGAPVDMSKLKTGGVSLPFLEPPLIDRSITVKSFDKNKSGRKNDDDKGL